MMLLISTKWLSARLSAIGMPLNSAVRVLLTSMLGTFSSASIRLFFRLESSIIPHLHLPAPHRGAPRRLHIPENLRDSPAGRGSLPAQPLKISRLHRLCWQEQNRGTGRRHLGDAAGGISGVAMVGPGFQP